MLSCRPAHAAALSESGPGGSRSSRPPERRRNARTCARVNSTRRFTTRTDCLTFVGDPTINESYLAFDAPVIAVADATVVAAVGDEPDAPPRTIVEGIPFDQLIGNHVILELHDDVFAVYAHLKQGSLRVAVGDTVEQGDGLARLGNSGNTTEAHLTVGAIGAASQRRPGGVRDRRVRGWRLHHHRRRDRRAGAWPANERSSPGRQHRRLRRPRSVTLELG